VVAAIDRAAFGGFWHFDTDAIADALAATRSIRLRVIHHDDQPVAYIVSGITETRAFIQRLAVLPTAQGRGYASALVQDALGWAGRHHVITVSINTQTDNTRARQLYQRHGFTLQPDHLGVVGFETSAR
jgi:GNAT superfamily N-acetyltransferase